MAEEVQIQRPLRGVRKNGKYRCKRCRQRKPGCKGASYRRHGCAGPKRPKAVA